MKVYLAPDVILSYIIGSNRKVDDLFFKIETGEIDAVVSTLTWYEVIACLKQVDNVNFARMGNVCYTCEFLVYPEGKTFKDIEFPPIAQGRIDRIRNLAHKPDEEELIPDIVKKPKYPGPDLTCFVCKKDLLEPKESNGVWKCPDKNCDSHLGD